MKIIIGCFWVSSFYVLCIALFSFLLCGQLPPGRSCAIAYLRSLSLCEIRLVMMICSLSILVRSVLMLCPSIWEVGVLSIQFCIHLHIAGMGQVSRRCKLVNTGVDESFMFSPLLCDMIRLFMMISALGCINLMCSLCRRLLALQPLC